MPDNRPYAQQELRTFAGMYNAPEEAAAEASGDPQAWKRRYASMWFVANRTALTPEDVAARWDQVRAEYFGDKATDDDAYNGALMVRGHQDLLADPDPGLEPLLSPQEAKGVAAKLVPPEETGGLAEAKRSMYRKTAATLLGATSGAAALMGYPKRAYQVAAASREIQDALANSPEVEAAASAVQGQWRALVTPEWWMTRGAEMLPDVTQFATLGMASAGTGALALRLAGIGAKAAAWGGAVVSGVTGGVAEATMEAGGTIEAVQEERDRARKMLEAMEAAPADQMDAAARDAFVSAVAQQKGILDRTSDPQIAADAAAVTFRRNLMVNVITNTAETVLSKAGAKALAAIPAARMGGELAGKAGPVWVQWAKGAGALGLEAGIEVHQELVQEDIQDASRLAAVAGDAVDCDLVTPRLFQGFLGDDAGRREIAISTLVQVLLGGGAARMVYDIHQETSVAGRTQKLKESVAGLRQELKDQDQKADAGAAALLARLDAIAADSTLTEAQRLAAQYEALAAAGRAEVDRVYDVMEAEADVAAEEQRIHEEQVAAEVARLEAERDAELAKIAGGQSEQTAAAPEAAPAEPVGTAVGQQSAPVGQESGGGTQQVAPPQAPQNATAQAPGVRPGDAATAKRLTAPVGAYAALEEAEDGTLALVGKNGVRIAIKMVDKLPSRWNAFWNKNDRAIRLKRGAADAAHALHEITHAMRDLGLITDPEWDRLLEASAGFDREAARKKYANAGLILDEEGLDHEQVAHTLERWQRTGEVPAALQGTWQKVKDFLRDLGHAVRLTERGAVTVARDVMAGAPLAREEAAAKPTESPRASLSWTDEELLDQSLFPGAEAGTYMAPVGTIRATIADVQAAMLEGKREYVPETEEAAGKDAFKGVKNFLWTEAAMLSDLIPPDHPLWKPTPGQSLVEYVRAYFSEDGLAALRQTFAGDAPPEWVTNVKRWHQIKKSIALAEDIRRGAVNLDRARKRGKAFLAGNRKTGGVSWDFVLGTCLPTVRCAVCYAKAAAAQRVALCGARVRHTIVAALYPQEVGRAVAAYVRATPKGELPMFRVNGAGDLTFQWQADAVNAAVAGLDRPVHIFSRSHVSRAAGTVGLDSVSNGHYDPADPASGVVVYKMGSIDAQLVKEYGVRFLRENMTRRGILNSFLVGIPEDAKTVRRLREQGVFCVLHINARKDVVQALYDEGLLGTSDVPDPEVVAPACPCALESGPFLNGCATCLASSGPCFAMGSQIAMTPDGRLIPYSAIAAGRAPRDAERLVPMSAVGVPEGSLREEIERQVAAKAYEMAADDLRGKAAKAKRDRAKGKNTSVIVQNPRSREVIAKLTGADIAVAAQLAAGFEELARKLTAGRDLGLLEQDRRLHEGVGAMDRATAGVVRASVSLEDDVATAVAGRMVRGQAVDTASVRSMMDAAGLTSQGYDEHGILAQAQDIAAQVSEGDIRPAATDAEINAALRTAAVRARYQKRIREVRDKAFVAGQHTEEAKARIEAAAQKIGAKAARDYRDQPGLSLADLRDQGFDAERELAAVMPQPPTPAEEAAEPPMLADEDDEEHTPQEEAPPSDSDGEPAPEDAAPPPVPAPPPPPPLDPQKVKDFLGKVRVLVENSLPTGVAHGSPRATRQYARTLATILEDGALRLTYGPQREWLMAAIARLRDTSLLGAVDKRAAEIAERIQRTRATQDRRTLLARLEALLRRPYLRGRESTTAELIHRKITPEARRWARVVRQAVRTSLATCESRLGELADLFADPSVLDDSDKRAEWRTKLEEWFPEFKSNNTLKTWDEADLAALAAQALFTYGGLRAKTVAEVAAAVDRLEQDIAGGIAALEKMVAERRARLEPLRNAIQAAMVPKDGASLPQLTPGRVKAGNALAAPMPLLLRMRRLLRFARPAEWREATAVMNDLGVKIQDAIDTRESLERRGLEELEAAIRGIYHTTNVRSVIRELERAREEYARFSRNPIRPVNLTRSQLIQILAACEQPDLAPAMAAHGRDAEYAAEIRRTLPPEDLALLDWMRGWYASQRAPLSEVTVRHTGVEVVSPSSLYMPVVIRKIQGGMDEGWIRPKLFRAWLLPRQAHMHDIREEIGVLGLWNTRLRETAHFMAWADTAVELRGIFGSAVVQDAMERLLGQDELQDFKKAWADAARGLQPQEKDAVMDTMRTATAYGLMAFNLGSALKQFSGMPQFGVEIGVKNIIPYVASAITPDGVATMRMLLASEPFKNRLHTGVSEAMRDALANSDPAGIRRAFNQGFRLIGWADAATSLIVGQAIYRDEYGQRIALGWEADKAGRYALEKTMMVINLTQQGSDPAYQAVWQRRHGPGGRLMTQFIGSPLQAAGYETTVLSEAGAGTPGWQKRALNTLVVGHVLTPAVYWLISEIYRKALGGDDDDQELERLAKQMILGPLSSMLFLGAVGSAVIDGLLTKHPERLRSMIPSEMWVGEFQLAANAFRHLVYDLDAGEAARDAAKFLKGGSAAFRQGARALEAVE